MDSNTTQHSIPSHVPPELVFNFSFKTQPGVEDDPHKAGAKVFDLPDVFYSPLADEGNGGWIVARIALAREVYQDWEKFSSWQEARASQLLGEDWILTPIAMDPPEHTKYRAIVNPIFSPKRVAELEAPVRKTCVELIEAVKDKGHCEFVSAFGRPYPVTVFLTLMGLPLEKTQTFVDWEEGLLHAKTPEQAYASASATRAYAEEVLNDRRAHPRDDLTSLIANAVVDGKPMAHREAVGMFFLFYLAGLDTVTSALGFIFRTLGTRLDLQRQLRENRDLIPNAIEELLRVYTLVESKRLVTHDLEFHGVKMKKGDWVCIGTPVSGHDTREYPDAGTIDFTRENQRHLAFASGPHRCIGSHLARREIKLAIEEWFDRVPEFRVKPNSPVNATAHIVWQLTNLELEWDV